MELSNKNCTDFGAIANHFDKSYLKYVQSKFNCNFKIPLLLLFMQFDNGCLRSISPFIKIPRNVWEEAYVSEPCPDIKEPWYFFMPTTLLPPIFPSFKDCRNHNSYRNFIFTTVTIFRKYFHQNMRFHFLWRFINRIDFPVSR